MTTYKSLGKATVSDDVPLPRLRAALWVKAQLRICNSNAIPAVISRRGDPDAGSVVVKVYRGRDDCTVFAPMMTMDGRQGWIRGTGAEPVSEALADAYIERQGRRDNDLWVLEIEDLNNIYALENVVD